MSWTWEVERLGLLQPTEDKAFPMPNLRNFCTGLRLFPASYAYAIASLFLSRNQATLTMADLQDVLQIVTEVVVRKLPPDFNPVLLGNVYTHIINVRREWKQEKVWAWFQDIVLPKCCPPPTHTKLSAPVSWSKQFDHKELYWSKTAADWLPAGYNVYNPSICGKYILLRTAQYRINYVPQPRYETWDDQTQKYGPYKCTKTVNYIYKNLEEPRQLAAVPVPFPNGTIQGLEDMRLFWWPKKQSHYAITTSLEVTQDRGPRQCLVKVNPDTGKVSHLIYLKGCPEFGLERRKQKNWLPFICQKTGDLCFIYSYCPFIVLVYNEADCQCQLKHAYIPSSFNHWRGSAGPVWLPLHDMYVALVHESAWPRYCHRFIALDKKLEKVTHATDRFTFGPDYMIEFSCGMQLTEDQQNMTVLYALHDAKAYRVDIPISYILSSLQTVS
jgi:hypothetical protein